MKKLTFFFQPQGHLNLRVVPSPAHPNDGLFYEVIPPGEQPAAAAQVEVNAAVELFYQVRVLPLRLIKQRYNELKTERKRLLESDPDSDPAIWDESGHDGVSNADRMEIYVNEIDW